MFLVSPEGWINWSNEDDAISGTQNITAKRSVMLVDSNGTLRWPVFHLTKESDMSIVILTLT